MSFFRHDSPELRELAELDVFAGLGRKQLGQMLEHTQRVTIAAGKVVMLERYFGAQLLVILEGVVAVSRDGLRVATLGAGDFLGEIGMLTGNDRTASVFAETDTRFLAFDKAPFEELVLGNPSLRAQIEAAAEQRTRGADPQ